MSNATALSICRGCQQPIGNKLENHLRCIAHSVFACSTCHKTYPSMNEAKQCHAWPKTAEIYLHSDKETMWDLGETMGLSEKALTKFAYTCAELKLTIAINEDGTSKIIMVEDRKVK